MSLQAFMCRAGIPSGRIAQRRGKCKWGVWGASVPISIALVTKPFKCNQMCMSEAWKELGEYFELEDGSLPDLLTFCFSRKEAVSEAFEYLRSISQPIDVEPTLYHLKLEKRMSLISVELPAMLVASGEAESFCLMFYGALSHDKKGFPELGVFVYPDDLQFYYRPGPDWSAGSLEKLFEIMSLISKIEGFRTIESLVPETEFYTKFWLGFQQHFKAYQAMVKCSTENDSLDRF